MVIEPEDLKCALDGILDTKKESSTSTTGVSNFASSSDYMHAPPPQRSIVAPRTHVSSSVVNLETKEEFEPMPASSDVLQGALERLGYRFNSMDDVRRLAALNLDSEEGRILSNKLQSVSEDAAALLVEYHRYLNEQLELEKELERKKAEEHRAELERIATDLELKRKALLKKDMDREEKARADCELERQSKLLAEAAKKVLQRRPIWQCTVCGRRTCNFRPAIIGYDEY